MAYPANGDRHGSLHNERQGSPHGDRRTGINKYIIQNVAPSAYISQRFNQSLHGHVLDFAQALLKPLNEIFQIRSFRLVPTKEGVCVGRRHHPHHRAPRPPPSSLCLGSPSSSLTDQCIPYLCSTEILAAALRGAVQILRPILKSYSLMSHDYRSAHKRQRRRRLC